MKNVLPVLLVLAVIGVAAAVWWIGEPPSTEPPPGPTGSPGPSGPSGASGPTGPTGPAAPTRTADFDPEGPPQTVRGVAVVAETGGPAEVDEIHAIPVGTDPTLVWGHATKDGRLVFPPFPPGDYDLVAYRLPDRIGIVHGLEIRDRPVHDLRIEMRRGGTLRFHITDTRKIRPRPPLDRAYRICLEQDGKIASSRAVLRAANPDRTDGTFDITAPPGRVHVYLTDHQAKVWKKEQVVDVKAGAVTTVRFSLE